MNGTMSAPVGAALRSSFTVLVSDDDPAVRRSLHMMLCAYGYDVQSYTSGQALLADPCAAAADCLVIDYSMPDVDGVTACKACGHAVGEVEQSSFPPIATARSQQRRAPPALMT